MLTNPFATALVVPLLFIACGAFAKKLARGSGWQRSDFFLGVELCLAAMAVALIYGLELAKLPVNQPDTATSVTQKAASTAAYLALCFFILLWILTIHQDWVKRTQNPRMQFVLLVIVTNLVGAGLLAAFVVFVIGV